MSFECISIFESGSNINDDSFLINLRYFILLRADVTLGAFTCKR